MKKIIVNLLRKKGYEIIKIPSVDTYIISFPKCGRTWLNVLMGKLFEQHVGISNFPMDTLLDVGIFNTLFPSEIPNVRFSHDRNEIFFTPPEKLEQNKKKYKRYKVIFLVRNPLDVVVSSYFEKTKRIALDKRANSFWQKFEGSISDYIHEKNGGFDTILKFYNIWYNNKDIPADFMLLKYEDLHKNTLLELNRIIDFIGLEDVSEQTKQTAIDYASFKNMRKIESSNTVKSLKLKPTDVGNTQTYKTRKGKVKGYLDYLKPSEIELLQIKIKKNLNKAFGY